MSRSCGLFVALIASVVAGCSSFEFEVYVSPIHEGVSVIIDGEIQKPVRGDYDLDLVRTSVVYEDFAHRGEGMNVTVHYFDEVLFERLVSPDACERLGDDWERETLYLSVLLGPNRVVVSGYQCEGNGETTTGALSVSMASSPRIRCQGLAPRRAIANVTAVASHSASARTEADPTRPPRRYGVAAFASTNETSLTRSGCFPCTPR